MESFLLEFHKEFVPRILQQFLPAILQKFLLQILQKLLPGFLQEFLLEIMDLSEKIEVFSGSPARVFFFKESSKNSFWRAIHWIFLKNLQEFLLGNYQIYRLEILQ